MQLICNSIRNHAGFLDTTLTQNKNFYICCTEVQIVHSDRSDHFFMPKNDFSDEHIYFIVFNLNV